MLLSIESRFCLHLPRVCLRYGIFGISTLTSLENHVPRLSITTGIEPFYATISCTESVATRPIYFWLNAHTTFSALYVALAARKKTLLRFSPHLLPKENICEQDIKWSQTIERKFHFRYSINLFKLFRVQLLTYVRETLLIDWSAMVFDFLFFFFFFFNFFHSNSVHMEDWGLQWSNTDKRTVL